jgi:hypothetical protein
LISGIDGTGSNRLWVPHRRAARWLGDGSSARLHLDDALAHGHEFGLIAAGEAGYLPGLRPKKTPKENLYVTRMIGDIPRFW